VVTLPPPPQAVMNSALSGTVWIGFCIFVWPVLHRYFVLSATHRREYARDQAV
jgi:hypothetical protein